MFHPDLASMTNTYFCEYSIKTPDDGQYIGPKHVEFFTKIKLRNSASRWLLLLKCFTLLFLNRLGRKHLP